MSHHATAAGWQGAPQGAPPTLESDAHLLVATSRWDSLIERIDRFTSHRDDGARLKSGYGALREFLGEDLWADSPFRPLSRMMANLVPEALAEWASLGRLLESLAAEQRQHLVRTLRDRLRSPDSATVLGALAELHVLDALRSRGRGACLLAPEGPGTCADLSMGDAAGTEIEVSRLSPGRAWDHAMRLSVMLEHGLNPYASAAGRFVQIRCTGFAGELFRHVPAAVEAFKFRMGCSAPWSGELAPGIACVVEAGRPGWVIVSGATIRSGNAYANESPLVRLPAKLAAEARQVRAGGIVIVLTSELSSGHELAGAEGGHFMLELVARIEDVGSRAPNVSAFVVLDEVVSDFCGEIPVLAGAARLYQGMKGLVRQRILYVPNPAARIPPHAEWKVLFAPPF